MNGKLFRIVLAGLFAATLTSCGASLEKRKDQADIHYRLGEVHLRERSIADALKELTKAVELYPDNANYHNALGLAYFVKGMNAEAYKSFDRAISIDPKLSDARLNKSAVYLSERKWDNAIEESQAAVKNIFYRTPELAYNNIGWAFHNKGDYGIITWGSHTRRPAGSRRLSSHTVRLLPYPRPISTRISTSAWRLSR